jgi:hypothetical protein
MSKPRQQFISEILVYPDPQVRSEAVLIARDPKTSGTAIYHTTDGGKTFRAMIPAPSSKDRVGAVLTLNKDKSAEWRFPDPRNQGLASQSSGVRIFIPFQIIGTLSTDATFGYFKVPSGKTVMMHEIQLCLQDSADQTVSIDVINGSGAAQGRVATLAPGILRSTFVFPNPIKMTSRSIWSMRILGCGTSSAPGQNLTALAGIEYQS